MATRASTESQYWRDQKGLSVAVTHQFTGQVIAVEGLLPNGRPI
ncbi:MAG: hypothetical protein ACYDAG_17415 [Chloroflexota bacterium]